MSCGLNQNFQMFKFSILAAMLLPLHIFAQQFSISGNVRDSKSNDNLPGATIELDGTRYFAIADELGRFRLSKVKEGTYSLTVRFVGYQTKTETVTIPDSNELEIMLDETAQLTDEVLVYSTRASDETPTTFSNVDAGQG
jgi:iron complex outermembrane recepter protein